MTNNNLRKAAILVATLDAPTAEAILDSVPDEQATRVRRMIVELGELDTAEQEAVIGEFFRSASRDPFDRPQTTQSGVRPEEPVELVLSSSPAVDEAPAEPFAFLSQASDDKLLSLLAGEHPQTVALVLSHLPHDRAASVLGALDGALQVDVLRRLVDLQQADPEVLREVESGLKSRVHKQIRRERGGSVGLDALGGIVEAADGPVKRNLLANLARHERTLAARLRPHSCEFADLAQFDGDALAVLLSTVDPDVTVLALAGAPLTVVDRVLEGLAPEEGKRLRKSIERLGPVRLSDIDEAQRRIADQARQLAMERRIEVGVSSQESGVRGRPGYK
jgi:flagellar motor switch protein FliG